jgi:hypothetical protein
MERQRQRTAASRPLRVIIPGDRVRWNRAYKLKIKRLTVERFQEMLRRYASDGGRTLGGVCRGSPGSSNTMASIRLITQPWQTLSCR